MKMRYIKFRGKRLDTREWVYGSLLTDNLTVYAINSPEIQPDGKLKFRHYEVDPATIGQYTWLNDKNGTIAYAGDIFQDCKGVLRTIFQVPGGFACEANPESFGYHSLRIYSPIMGLSDEQNASWFSGVCTVIGNIHDNLELLKLDEE